MGKTYKSGFRQTGNSLNYVLKRKLAKKCYKKKIRHQYKKEVVSMLKETDNLNLNTSFKSIPFRRDLSKMYETHPIGYCSNCSILIKDAVANVLYHMRHIIKYKYSTDMVIKHENLCNGFKSLSEDDKIMRLLNEINSQIENDDKCLIDTQTQLKDMKKQLKRRGYVGYFKGHKKIYKY